MKVLKAPSPGRGSIMESKLGRRGGRGGERNGEEEEANGGGGLWRRRQKRRQLCPAQVFLIINFFSDYCFLKRN